MSYYSSTFYSRLFIWHKTKYKHNFDQYKKNHLKCSAKHCNWKALYSSFALDHTEVLLEAAHQTFSREKVFWKYAANLQNTHAEVFFQKSCFASLLKSHFSMDVLL